MGKGGWVRKNTMHERKVSFQKRSIMQWQSLSVVKPIVIAAKRIHSRKDTSWRISRFSRGSRTQRRKTSKGTVSFHIRLRKVHTFPSCNSPFCSQSILCYTSLTMKYKDLQQEKFMPQKPHGEVTLPSGKKIKVGPDALMRTKAKDTSQNIFKKIADSAKEGIFPPPVIKVQPF